MLYKLHIFLLTITISTLSFTQDVEQVTQQLKDAKKANPLQVSGGLGVNSGFSHAYGLSSQRPPFYWSLRGDLTLRFFDMVDAPLSISYTPQSSNFDYPFQRLQPFNQIGISPHYKSITVHIGYRSMAFSQFSLSGNNFYGAGIEWKPQNRPWETSFAYGRFARAIEDTALIDLPGATLFNRWGWAAKVTRKFKNGAYSFVMFNARDNINSYAFPDVFIEDVTPKENLITGIVLRQRLLKKVTFQLEIMQSAFTDNTLSIERDNSNIRSIYNYAGPFFTPKDASSYQKAIDSRLNWTPRFVQIQLAYKRIDPGYQSLGIPFLNNDLEITSIGFTKRLLQNKLTASSNIGLQRNNLQNTEIDETRRIAMGGSLNYQFAKQWNTSIHYTNYTTNTVKIRIEEIDSLSYYQVTENLAFNLRYQFGDSEKSPQNISLNSSWQQAQDLEFTTSELRNLNIGYSYSVRATKLQIQSRWSVLHIQSINQADRIGTGPTFSIGKSVWQQKLHIKKATNLMIYYQNGATLNQTINTRLNVNYQLSSGHQLGLSFNWIDRRNATLNNRSGELQTSINYTYHFMKNAISSSRDQINRHDTSQ